MSGREYLVVGRDEVLSWLSLTKKDLAGRLITVLRTSEVVVSEDEMSEEDGSCASGEQVVEDLPVIKEEEPKQDKKDKRKKKE